jgi:hypothetical protein
MNKNQILSLVRSILKIGGGIGVGYAIHHGIGDQVTWTQILGGLTAALGLVASHSAHAVPTASIQVTPTGTQAP